MEPSPHVSTEGVALQEIGLLINQSVAVALNIKLFGHGVRIWAELKEMGRDYGEWTYGTLQDGHFSCGVRLPSSLAQTVEVGQVGWWSGVFEATGQSADSRKRLSQYDAWRFVAHRFEAQGVSARFYRLQETEQQLRAEGLVPHTPRPWPTGPFPWIIAVVGHPQSKGFEDVQVKFAGHSQIAWHPIPVEIGQVASVVQGIQQVDTSCQALVIVRGGGDLEVFDQAPVVRALAACPVYTIAGIGHATDRVLANAVVDYAATTPTDAALYVLAQITAQQEQQDRLALAEQNQQLTRQMEVLASRAKAQQYRMIGLGVLLLAILAIVLVLHL